MAIFLSLFTEKAKKKPTQMWHGKCRVKKKKKTLLMCLVSYLRTAIISLIFLLHAKQRTFLTFTICLLIWSLWCASCSSAASFIFSSFSLLTEPVAACFPFCNTDTWCCKDATLSSNDVEVVQGHLFFLWSFRAKYKNICKNYYFYYNTIHNTLLQ